MIIRELFAKQIDRPINGVIKADDRESIWQELDEYVVTGQLTSYMRQFFDAYLAGIDNPGNPIIASRMGVWVSGFFGSGKSHFIKILSYLLENIEATNPKTGEKRHAVSFFDQSKIPDAMLLADIQRAVRNPADVILFNIDAKADSKSDRDVILQVFLRVFNEKLGFSGDAPHIANMERYLVEKGAYETFKQAFQTSYGSPWEQERDAVDFLRDNVVEALSKALGMTEESAGAWFDSARDTYRINIESFAKLVNDYLATKPDNHRLIFLVDEVGQFIGDNTQLMLNLQTITEQLGTLCGGRAWVVVTSQEDIDAAIGESNKSKTQDFSKIQGRFNTRLSLASSNTDEVIGKRLLAKTEAAHVELRDVFAAKGDIINNQLAFGGETVALRGYRDAADYVNNYPFPPYQFFLLSKVFEAIRRNGATGKHLSKGERSLLDAFQSAATHLANEAIDALVPLYDFYPSIESFLDSTVRHSIDNAEKEIGGALEAFDHQLLKTLFLIRYIPEIVKGSVDNLATLCVDEIDCDKLALKRRIQESLARLEKQSLVSRNGEEWMFLTNEEQDIAREISNEAVSHDDMNRKLGELVFDQVWRGNTKVRHRESKADYEFNRMLDGRLYRNTSHELSLHVITPLYDDYGLFNDSKCRLLTAQPGLAIIRLNDADRLYAELQMLKKIDNYIESKYESASLAAKKIFAFKKDENRTREERLREQIDTLLCDAVCYAMGEAITIKASSAGTVLDEVINYLVTNTYNKLNFLQPCNDAYEQIRATLQADSVEQQSLLSSTDVPNAQALGAVREFLHIKASSTQVILEDVVTHFSGIPYGWKPAWEIVLLIARLFMAGEIKLMMDGDDLEPRQAVEPLTKTIRFKNVSILKRKVTGALELKKARDLYKQLFAQLAREDEDGLVSDFRSRLQNWASELATYQIQAKQPHHPGAADIDKLQAQIKKQLAIRDAFAFIEALNEDKNSWLDAEEDLRDLQDFYKPDGQIQTWSRLLKGLRAFEQNSDKLRADDKASPALSKLESIRSNARPYGQIKDIDALLATVDGVNQQLIDDKRQHALGKIEERINSVQADLDAIHAPADLCNRALLKLQKLKAEVQAETGIPRILYLQSQAATLQSEAIDLIANHQQQLQRQQQQALEQEKKRAAEAGSKAATANTSPTTTVAEPPAHKAEIKTVKTVKSVHAASLLSSDFLESEADVDAYLSKLRSELLKVVQAGQRARVE